MFTTLKAASLNSFGSSSCVNLQIIDWEYLPHPAISTYTIKEEFFTNPNKCDAGIVAANSWFNFWLGRNYANGDYFIVDLGCCVTIRKVILRNSYNPWNDASGSGER